MRPLAVALLALLVPVTASAQVCLGGSDVSKAQPYHFIGSIGFEEDATSIAAGGLGGNDKFFGGGTGEIAWIDRPDLTTVTGYAFAGFGAAQMGTQNRRFMVCPIVTVSNAIVHNIDGLETSLWGLNLLGELSLGVVAVDTPAFKVVPTFGVGFARLRLRAKNGNESRAETETDPTFHVGAGFVLHERFTLTPLLTGTFDGDPTFVLAFSVNFPRK